MNIPEKFSKLQCTVHNLNNHGEGVSSYQGYTIFIDGALPGEVVEAEIFAIHKKYGRARLLKVLEPSIQRVVPPCPFFGECGGCQLMHLAYPAQLLAKQQTVIDALQRIGKLHTVKVEPCQPSPLPLAYRNKIQLPVREGFEGISLGLYARSSHDLIAVDTCRIHCGLGEEVFQVIRELLQQAAVTAYQPSTGGGELRHVLIKSAVQTEQVLVVLVGNGPPSRHLIHVAEQIMLRCPTVRGVVHNKNTSRDNVILGPSYTTLKGAGFIQEELCGLTFKVSPASFFQVNPAQAERLYAKVLEFAALQGQEVVLDAYCGVGTLALFLAKQAKRVIGVECVAAAIEDARENATLNGIQNATFIHALAEKFIATLPAVDIVILNPPRKGCERSLLDEIGRLKPSRLVYVSCDPATLARDLAHLHTLGYTCSTVQPYDMFPQTAHVECVASTTLH
jgi:23S rRNA (uracil1939-C5)-methyltransferase